MISTAITQGQKNVPKNSKTESEATAFRKPSLSPKNSDLTQIKTSIKTKMATFRASECIDMDPVGLNLFRYAQYEILVCSVIARENGPLTP